MSQTCYPMINRGLKEQVKRNLYIGRHWTAPPNYHTQPWCMQIHTESTHVFYHQHCLLGNGFINVLWGNLTQVE